MDKIHIKSKELEIAKIHYIVILGLNIVLCRKVKNITQRGFPTPPSCKSSEPSPQNNLDEKNVFFHL